MIDKSCQYEPSSPISLQEQPSEVDYLNKNFLSPDIQAKLNITVKSCQYEPSSPISVQEQTSEVDYLNKNLLSVDLQAKLNITDKSCQYEPSHQYQFKNSLLKLTI